MCPHNPQINLYDPKALETLDQAFEATWVVLQARVPFRDFQRDTELKSALSQKLMRLAADGVTDPIELREWALEGLPKITPKISTPNPLSVPAM